MFDVDIFGEGLLVISNVLLCHTSQQRGGACVVLEYALVLLYWLVDM